MKIAVIGMGKVGSVLGQRWAQAGHAVTFGVRDPDSPEKQDRARAAGASLASVRQAAADAAVVLVAVPWRAVPDALQEAGDLSNKVLRGDKADGKRVREWSRRTHLARVVSCTPSPVP